MIKRLAIIALVAWLIRRRQRVDEWVPRHAYGLRWYLRGGGQ